MKKRLFSLFVLCFAIWLGLCACGDTPSNGTPNNGTPSNGTSNSDTPNSDTSGGETSDGESEDEQGAPCDVPVLRWSAAKEELSWQAIKGARAYEVTVNGEKRTVTATSLAFHADGSYKVTVRALGGDGYTDSAASAPLTFSVGWSTSVK